MNLPTFLIGGSPRAGTTFLYEVLDEHPDIFLAKPRNPEPKFFLIDDEYQKGLPYYSHKYFSGAEREQSGPATPAGSPSFPSPSEKNRRITWRIRASPSGFAPCCPTSSCCLCSATRSSGVFQLSVVQEKSFGNAPVRRSGGDRSERPGSLSDRIPLFAALFVRLPGMYAVHLRPYYAAFPREQIRVVLLEDLERIPRPESTRSASSWACLRCGPAASDTAG